MWFKKSFKKVQKEINYYLNKEDYFFAGVLAENSGYKRLEKLADGYYNVAMQKFKERNILKHLFPTKECHQNVIDNLIYITDYSLNKHWIKN